MSKFLHNLVRSIGKSCEGKIKYPSEVSAQRNAEAMMVKKGNGEIFEHYLCAFCDGFHIGHRTNFDWIPKSHFGHWLMLNQYQCLSCHVKWFTNTVFSTRILTHFPKVIDAIEHCVVCPKCKNAADIGWFGRKWINLETIEPNSDASLEQLWEQGLDTVI